ncbi:hypothetical protein P167DRAFT_548187 [Morchella conica CCBAS932]|uniref:Uncharacterized protein n=1 Tax=Morchella conica CCBAS932 TaxID=1392247 RepID=A0A3N4KFF7_9PEZI|nr:hypothetical protein P167DRAFT_548187 [Morchella conica CCBAS932]
MKEYLELNTTIAGYPNSQVPYIVNYNLSGISCYQGFADDYMDTSSSPTLSISNRYHTTPNLDQLLFVNRRTNNRFYRFRSDLQSNSPRKTAGCGKRSTPHRIPRRLLTDNQVERHTCRGRFAASQQSSSDVNIYLLPVGPTPSSIEGLIQAQIGAQ